MNNGPEKFDGELIITADREIYAEDPLMVSIIDERTGAGNIPGPLLLEYLATLEEIRTLSIIKKPTDLQRRELKQRIEFAGVFARLMLEERVINKRLLEVITEGKVKAGLWVDSIGGDASISEKVKYAIHYLYRDGEVSLHSYVHVKAASAAFDLAFLANDVNAMGKSIFNWHFSDSEDSPRVEKVRKIKRNEELDEDTADQIAELRDILDCAHSDKADELWDNVLKQLNNPQNVDGDILFEGDYLHEVGLVNHCYDKVDELIAKFKADFPLHADKNSTFFNEGVAKRVAHQYRSEPYWLDSKTLGMTTKVARNLELGKSSKRKHKKP